MNYSIEKSPCCDAPTEIQGRYGGAEKRLYCSKCRRLLKKLEKRNIVVAVSGGFDPVHVGHLRMFREARTFGTRLVVILNCDKWLIRKKGFVFMPQEERAELIRGFKGVDEVFIYESDKDDVCGALLFKKPDIFANGGDRKEEKDIPEAEVCRNLGIEMVFNVGGGKVQSSSELVKKAKLSTSK